MKRAVLLVLLVSAAAGCADDRISLTRGPLGPASYDVTLDVSGDVALAAETVVARLDVAPRPGGATLRMAIEDDEPILAELESTESGRLRLETVEGVSPTSAGETDLASLVGQLDPPLPDGRVRIGDSWSSRRRIATGAVEADLETAFELVRFRRVGGRDAAVLAGTVTGTLRASTASGTFDGTVAGDTEIAWTLDPGRLAASRTSLRWSIGGAGSVLIVTHVAPR